VCLAILAIAGALFYAPPVDPRFALPRRVFGDVVFVVSGAFIVWMTGLLHAALRQETAARETERLLRAELQHRVKNTLAVVQSLAHQTLRAPADREVLRRDFTERLVTLASTHDLLDAAGWRDVTMSALAAAALAPFLAARDAQVRMAGEDFTVPPEQAVTLALCLNELATNAAKHGALAEAEGQVELTWQVRDEGGARVASVAWAERGGPPVSAPAADGFGSRLLRRGLGPRSRARAELAFAPDGVRWRTEFALEAARG
jgi:two-component sensor histidine kinase